MKLPIQDLIIITKNALHFTAMSKLVVILLGIVWLPWSDCVTEILGQYCII